MCVLSGFNHNEFLILNFSYHTGCYKLFYICLLVHKSMVMLLLLFTFVLLTCIPGHGPFSHMFDGMFIPKARPEVNWKVRKSPCFNSLEKSFLFSFLVSHSQCCESQVQHASANMPALQLTININVEKIQLCFYGNNYFSHNLKFWW